MLMDAAKIKEGRAYCVDLFKGKIQDELHRHHTTWHLGPVLYLKYILSNVAPISCDLDQFKSFLIGGQTEAPKGRLLELLEYATGDRAQRRATATTTSWMTL